MTPLSLLWTLSGILSCLIFLYAERHSLRHMDFSDSLLAVLILIGLCILGPISLTLMTLASLVHYLAQRA